MLCETCFQKNDRDISIKQKQWTVNQVIYDMLRQATETSNQSCRSNIVDLNSTAALCRTN